jgi:putative ABC transport system ATP-binding protein
MSADEASGPLIETRDLKKIYVMGDEEVRALDGVSITIHHGELIAIMGKSGSGKSTLMNLLGCLDTPTSGHYLLEGRPVEDMEDEALAQMRNENIGFVFQTFQLLSRKTALENVVLPLTYRRPSRLSMGERRDRAAQALHDVGLGDRMLHRPNEMSGGQRQRVAVARALVSDPALILADEPTGNLDSRTTEEILDLIVGLQRDQGRTVLVVTHEEDVANRCDRVVWLSDGKVTSDKTRDEAA